MSTFIDQVFVLSSLQQQVEPFQNKKMELLEITSAYFSKTMVYKSAYTHLDYSHQIPAISYQHKYRVTLASAHQGSEIKMESLEI